MVSSTKAQNNVRHMERQSPSPELMAQLGKVMGSSKIHPENVPFGEAAQIWIHSFWPGPQGCIKTLTHQFQSNSGWKGPLWRALESNLLPRHSAALNDSKHGDPTASLGSSVSDQPHDRQVSPSISPQFPTWGLSAAAWAGAGAVAQSGDCT